MFGWVLLVLGAFITLLVIKWEIAKELLLPYISVSFLGITPISTDVAPEHFVSMGLPILLALFLPYVISRFIYKEHKIRYNFTIPRRWSKKKIGYLFFALVLSYTIIPFYLVTSGVYKNWPVEPGFYNLFVLFLGTNLLGIWDELFFVCTVLGILKRYFSFKVANIATTIIFTAFLYELGFQGWGIFIVPIFAFLQGWAYNKTNDLVYVITIHLTVDLVLYLALLHAHYPEWPTIILTK